MQQDTNLPANNPMTQFRWPPEKSAELIKFKRNQPWTLDREMLD